MTAAVRMSLCRRRLSTMVEHKREQWHRCARFAATTTALLDQALAADPSLPPELRFALRPLSCVETNCKS